MNKHQICIDLRRTRKQRWFGMRVAIDESPANRPPTISSAHDELLDRFLEGGEAAILPEHGPMIEEMAMVTPKKWSSTGRKLVIGFLDGSPTQRAKVRAHAVQWLRYASVRFDFRDSGPYDIRISFTGGPGSWSTVGTDCFTVTDPNQPTLNLGWLNDDTPDDEYRRVTLHEFGHVLGCIHEHESPAGGIQWNKPAVYAAYAGLPNKWNAAMVDRNIFATYDKRITQFSELDPLSIMMYPIPASFTTDGFNVGINNDLSVTDINFIQQQYPGAAGMAAADPVTRSPSS